MKAGDQVSVTLPDGTSTPGMVSTGRHGGYNVYVPKGITTNDRPGELCG